MIDISLKPKVIKLSDNEWEFIMPKEYYNEATAELYNNAVAVLDANDELAQIVFKQIIKSNPYHIGAYTQLSRAYENLELEFESYLTAEKAYRVGKECLPKEFDLKKDKLTWYASGNRPFLNACYVWAASLFDNNEFDKAIEVLNELLQLDPEDHTGARYIKLVCLFRLNNYLAARRLINAYPDEGSIEFAYGKVLLAVLASDFEKATELLPDALKVNPYLPSEVVKKRHTPPMELEMGMEIGSKGEAYVYWIRNEAVYKQENVIAFFTETKKLWSKKK